MEERKQINLPVNRLYEGRMRFSIIGLTGMAGSGCSTLARYMSSRDFLVYVRKPSEIIIDTLPDKFEDNEFSFQNDKQGVSNKAVGGLVFKQKYSICYEFAQKYYKEYRVLKYTHMLWLYVLLSIKQKKGGKCSVSDLTALLLEVIADKYQPRRDENNDKRYKALIGFEASKRKKFIENVLVKFEKWPQFCQALNDLPRCYVDNLDDSRFGNKALWSFIEQKSVFEEFVAYLLNALAIEDYYSLCFLHHRLATQIRKCGEPFSSSKDIKDSDAQCVFNVAKLINIVIKGIKNSDGESECRVVIDSIRNSLEARYFKERYTAFYLICVNDSENRERRLVKSIQEKMPQTQKNENLLGEVLDSIKRINSIELKGKDFSKGKFASPDVENVIADAEIHISNTFEQKVDADRNVKEQAAIGNGRIYEFYSMAEQWMKYSSLILHPGLITPSAEERCMVVAYTAKFNSSCLSRQVGAVITNQYHSIRTIGWNEVPYGQIPCGLRELHRLNDVCIDCHHIYSEFEIGPYKTYGSKTFFDKIDDNYPGLLPIEKDAKKPDIEGSQKPAEMVGLPFSYCFKSLHNTFEGEKNQVYTRSLHAEENAILQMAKYGGEPLMNGVIYVTASPCELCAKKLYQIGVRKIVYIDPYPGISMNQIIRSGFKRPHLKLFQGAYGASYFKLYQPFMSYKDEVGIRLSNKGDVKTKSDLLDTILKKVNLEAQPSYTHDEIEAIVESIFGKNKEN